MTFAKVRTAIFMRPYLFTRLWSIIIIAVLCIVFVGFCKSVRAAQKAISQAEHSDLVHRVDKLETEQSNHDIQIARNSQRLTYLEEKIVQLDSVDLRMMQGHEAILERVAKLETVSNENQLLLRGVGVGIMLLLIEMLARTIWRKGIAFGVKEVSKSGESGDD